MALAFRTETAPQARKRRNFLSREEIIDAAALVLERDGYDALNMRSIGAELGVQAAALYRYVAGRDEIDDLLFDHLMAGVAPVVGERHWQDDLRAIADAWRARLLDKRDATRIALALVSIGPNIAPLMEACLSTLRRSGMSDEDVAAAYDTLMLFVHSYASSQAIFRRLASRDYAPRYSALPPEWANAYPTVVAMADRVAAAPDFDAQFAFGLDALVAAIGAPRIGSLIRRAAAHA